MRRPSELAARRRELARFRGALPAAQLFARQDRLEQGALLGRRLRQARGQLGPAHVAAGSAISAGRLEAPGRVALHELGVCLDIEKHAAVSHAHDRGGDADLDFVSACLAAQRRQDALRQAKHGDGVEGGVIELGSTELRRRPVRQLLALVELEAEMRLGDGGEAQAVASDRQARRLQRAVHLAGLDAGGLEEAQLESGVVRDAIYAVQKAQHLVARAEEVDDRDAFPAAV